MSTPGITTEDLYSALRGAIDAGFCLLRIEFDAGGVPVDYRFVETNERFVTHSGLTDAVGCTVRELVPGIEHFWIERYAQVAASREPIRFEQRSMVMNRCFDVHAFPVGPAQAHLVGLLFNDVTAARAREDNRRFLVGIASIFESEVSLEDIMTSVGARLGDFLGTKSCLFCEIDEHTDTITVAYGWTREGEPNLIRTFRTSDYFHEDFLVESRAHRTVAINDVQADPRTGADSYAELNVRSFVTVPHHTDGRWTHFFAVTDSKPREWTAEELEFLQSFARLVFSKLERARADAAIRKSEARFRAMADSVPQIVWITDAQGRIEFFNRQWTLYTGIDYVPETAGDVAGAVIHPDDIVDTMSRFQAALDAGVTYQMEHRIRAASGDYRWFLVRGEPELDAASGLPHRWYGASIDIHDRRMIEQQLAEADRRKDEFLATLAHELRNPLVPIRTGLALLDMNPAPDAAARARNVMSRQLTHMVRLIDDLLDISRINSNKIELRREVLDVRSVLEEVIDAYRATIEQAGHRLVVSLPPGPMHVDGDRTRLVQVFGNLLTNAAKYTPRGGTVEVSADAAGDEVQVSVRDTGVGIDPSALGGIFEMFSQVAEHTERAQGGLGIGLSLVRRIVEMHGGTLVAESAGAGTGATFRVRLPRSRETRSPAPDAAHHEGGQARRPLAILVVDDNVDAAEIMKAVLEVEGHRVRLAHSGEEALAVASGLDLDAALIDIGLPAMDGYELARRLRGTDSGRAMTLIAVTGWGSDADRQRAFASGFDHHVTKPADAGRIAAILGAVPARARSR